MVTHGPRLHSRAAASTWRKTMTQIIECPPSERKPAVVDLTAVKTRQQAMWASGDFAVIGTTLQIVGETLCEAANLESGARVLDVACGNGNAALAAARRWCRVTGLDYVSALLRRAGDRARAEGLELALIEGDAEQLPFQDASFDAAVSTFGVMFAPDQERAARELMRVVRPGGTIALASWTPSGFIGQMLVSIRRHVPSPPGVASPIYWGTDARIEQLFTDVRSIRTSTRDFVFRYESTAHFIDIFRRYYGPTFMAYAALDADGQARLTADLGELCARFNRSESTFAVPAEYLEVVIER
jgi:ubiquinone/menaquinone biosynthesis C-methylase UbiE